MCVCVYFFSMGGASENGGCVGSRGTYVAGVFRVKATVAAEYELRAKLVGVRPSVLCLC